MEVSVWIRATAWTSIAINALYILIAPTHIGKPTEPFYAWKYIVGLVSSVLEIVLCGAILGWWG